MSIGHQLWLVFGWPYGIVVGNILAEFLIVGSAFAFRHFLMRKFVELHHKHKTEHAARLAGKDKP